LPLPLQSGRWVLLVQHRKVPLHLSDQPPPAHLEDRLALVHLSVQLDLEFLDHQLPQPVLSVQWSLLHQ
jgi:hypothetical protein